MGHPFISAIAEDRVRGEAWRAEQLRWLERKQRQFHLRMLIVRLVGRVVALRHDIRIIPRRRAVRRVRVARAAAASSRGDRGDPDPAPELISQHLSLGPSCASRAGAFVYLKCEAARGATRAASRRRRDETANFLMSRQ
jgi:hypothetical protein